MAKKKVNLEKIRKEHKNEVDVAPEYSLMVDPLNKYEFSDEQKKFIECYIQLRNVEVAANISNLDPNEALAFALSYNAQEEIRRINKAITHRQFETKMANLDQIGGYLTSLLTGENLPFAEILSVQDKLQVTKMLVEVNKLQSDAIENPSAIMTKNLDVDLNNLSVKTIKKLLENMDKDYLKDIDMSKISPEEIAKLKIQPKEVSELMNLVKRNGGKIQ